MRRLVQSKNMRLSAMFLLCALSVFGQGTKTALDKATFEAYLRHLLSIPKEVQIKIDDAKPGPMADLKQVDVHFTLGANSEEETYFVSADGKKIIRGYVYKVDQNPFQSELDKLKTDLAPSFGTPGAPVVLVDFSDFECPNCKEEALALRANLEKTFPGKVRFYFKNYPLASIHPWAKPAAIAGRCIFRQEPAAFWKFHDWIYENQGDLNPDNLQSKVLEWSKTENLDGIQLGRCLDTKATEADVDKDSAEGKSLAITATPTLFINGRRLVGNYPWVNLEQIIRQELDYQSSSADAGEKCCEVTIPNPLKKKQ
jgi:protein-disulfide isomerase